MREFWRSINGSMEFEKQSAAANKLNDGVKYEAESDKVVT
jgi:hypothetical protein